MFHEGYTLNSPQMQVGKQMQHTYNGNTAMH